MARANLVTAPGVDRYASSFMPHTIANAIADSKREFPFITQGETMRAMKYPADRHTAILKKIVDESGGPAEFARKYSNDSADKPIDATYVSQILNGHRPFRDTSRKNMARRAGLPVDYFETGDQVAQSPLYAREPDYGISPRISVLIEKLKSIKDDHPAVPSVEWALRDIEISSDRAKRSGNEPGWANIGNSLGKFAERINKATDGAKKAQK